MTTTLTAPIALNPEDFRTLIRLEGETFLWYQALPCDCNSPESSAERRTCGNCEQGYVYLSQDVDAAVRIYIGRTKKDMVDTELGLLPRGTSTLTAMPDEVTVTFADKLVLNARTSTAKERYIRGSGASDALRGKPAIAIARVLQVGDTTTTYVPGTDYSLVGDSIVWVGGHGPATGTIYTVIHTYHPTYLFLGELIQEPPPSQYGELLPLYGALTKKLLFNGAN